MPSFGYPRGVSQSARICPETRQREERGQIGRRKRRRITCSCWGQGHASTMTRGGIPQEVELTGEIGGWKPRPRGDYNRGPKPLPGGLGGWKPRPREPGARATAGRTRGLEATAEGTGGQSHCRKEEPEWGPEPRPCKQRRSQCKEQNTKSLTLYGVHLPTQTHTTHPEGSFGGRKPRPREPGAGATAGRVVDRSRSREQQVNRSYLPARS